MELLYILKIICEVMGDPHEHGKFNSQTMQASNDPSCKANKVQEIKADNADVNDANVNMPDYFRSNINRATDIRTHWVLINKIHNEFSDFFRNEIF